MPPTSRNLVRRREAILARGLIHIFHRAKKSRESECEPVIDNDNDNEGVAEWGVYPAAPWIA